LCVVISLLGTTLALFQFSDHLFEFLNILGVFTPSIAAIYLLDFFWLKKQRYDLDKVIAWGIPALLSWVLSSVIALFIYFEVFQITGAYFMDSFLIAGLCYYLFSK